MFRAQVFINSAMAYIILYCFGQYKILVGWAVPEVTATFQKFGKIKASPAQVLLVSPSWIHKVLYTKCPWATLSCVHIFPKWFFFCWKHFATFLCSRQAFSASSKICYNSTEDERSSFPKMCSQFFYPKHFLGLKTRMKYSNFIQVCQFL